MDASLPALHSVMTQCGSLKLTTMGTFMLQKLKNATNRAWHIILMIVQISDTITDNILTVDVKFKPVVSVAFIVNRENKMRKCSSTLQKLLSNSAKKLLTLLMTEWSSDFIVSLWSYLLIQVKISDYICVVTAFVNSMALSLLNWIGIKHAFVAWFCVCLIIIIWDCLQYIFHITEFTVNLCQCECAHSFFTRRAWC